MKRILIVCAILFSMASCEQNQETTHREKENTSLDSKAVRVTVKQVESETNRISLSYSGTVEASQTIPLSFRTSGTVEKVLVGEGDFVKKGQLLATIDDTDAQNMHEIALSKYKQASDAYERLQSVYDKGSLPEIKWVEMETNLSQAKSSLELSKNNLKKCNLISPASGIIGRRNIETGMSSINLSGSPLEIVDIKTVNIKISVPENEISKIKKGLKTEILVAAAGNKKYEGKITTVSPVADLISRTYEAKIKVVNHDLELKPGMVCDVSLNIPSGEDFIVIPYQSISKDSDGNTFVFLVDTSNKKAHKQVVAAGGYFGDYIEIISGLSPGQTIVCKGVSKLTDNSLITW